MDVERHGKVSEREEQVAFALAIGIAGTGFFLGTDKALSICENFRPIARFFSLNEPYGMPGAAKIFWIFPWVSAVTILALALLYLEWRRGFMLLGQLKPSPWILVPTGIVLYVPLWGPILGIGDSAVYAGLIEQHALGAITVHWGNTFLGIIWTSILPVDVPRAMNLWGIVAGIGACVVAAKIADFILEDRIAAFFTGVALLCAVTWWQQSVFYKSYMGQTFWLFLALYFWIKDRPFISGFAFLISILYSPMVALAAPFFLFGKVNLKKLAAAVATSLPLYLVFLWVYRMDFFYGPRGIFPLSSAPPDLGLSMIAMTFFLLLAINFSIAWLLVPVGAIETFSWPRRRSAFFWAVILLSTVTMMIFGSTFAEFSAELPFLFIPALLIGAGYLKLAKTQIGKTNAACLVAVVLALMTYMSLLRIIPEFATRSTFRRVSIETAKLRQPGDIFIMPWSEKMIFEQYAFHKTYTPYVINIETPDATSENLKNALAGYKRVWVLGQDMADNVEKFIPLKKEIIAGGYVWLGQIKSP